MFDSLVGASILNGSGHRTCGFFSSTACFADFYQHPDTKTIKKDCDGNGNNCKIVKEVSKSGAHPNAAALIVQSLAGH